MERELPPLLAACLRRPTPYTPVWLMRQAGRYLPEYREMRGRYSFLQMCKEPELALRVTLLPIERFGLDGAILFSDLLLPLEAMGLRLRYGEGGPAIENPIESRRDVEALRTEGVLEGLSPVMEAARLARRELPQGVALIGFAGAPFTLASYAVEGGGARDFSKTKGLMYGEPETFGLLMEKIAEVITLFLRAQVEAGCQVLQLFDSWAGALSPMDYRRYVLPYTKRVIGGLEGKAPLIHFATSAAGILELMASAGGDVIGVDWRVDLGEAWKRVGYNRGIQGNLDPALLLGPRALIEEGVREVLSAAAGRPGHIFNLGHGVLPQTPEENVAFLVETVRRLSERADWG